jgi:hypothetical protein
VSAAPSPIRPVRSTETAPPTETRKEVTGPRFSSQKRLTIIECTAAFGVFVGWLFLFAAGILIDTEPYRIAISPEGAAAMAAEETPLPGAGAPAAPEAQAPAATAPVQPLTSSKPLMISWLVVLMCYLPLNLAWLCITSSTLGAFGNRVNLSDDEAQRRGRDDSNPYVSALLRGFFVYLFMTSGLLLLDDAPFSSPGPGQYIRLAGFLSLFSFVTSYQPRLFTNLVASASQRITREDENVPARSDAESETVYAKKTTVEVAHTVHKDSDGE